MTQGCILLAAASDEKIDAGNVTVVGIGERSTPEGQTETIERVNVMHVKACPNARSVMAAIDIETNVEIVPVAEPAAAAS